MSISRGKRVLQQRTYLLPERRLVVERVNAETMWNDRVWRFPRKRKDVLIDWGTGVSEDQWMSEDWQRLVNLGRRLVLAEIDGAVDAPLDLLTIAANRAPLLHFLRWMLIQDYFDMSEITTQSCGYYRDDLKDEKVDDEDPEESISQSRLSGYLDVPLRFFRHRLVFKNFSEMVPSEHPYAGQSARTVAEEIIVRATKHIPRVPVEVQNAVLPEARKWIWEYSTDILSLQALFVAGREAGSHLVGRSHSYHTDKAILPFRFDLAGSLEQPWRPPLEPKSTVTRHHDGKKKTKSVGPTAQFKYLQTDLRDAAVITLQGLGGMRIGDLAEFQAEPRQPDGLPYCLVRKRSPTGLFELYFARGRAVKGGDEDDEPEEEWLLGSHPVGTNSVPDAVKAVLVLDELFKPWRELAESGSLIVSLGRGMGPPRAVREQPEVMLDTLRKGQISFVASYVALPKEYEHWALSTHQWRKSYAEDIVTLNDGLVPAVQEQFKQLSRTVLETAYVGSAPYFNRLIADQRGHSTGDAMFAIIHGGSIAVGETEKDVRAITENLGQLLEKYPTETKKKSALRRMCDEEGITLWGQLYGDCMFRAVTARCHERQHGEFDPDAKRPLAIHVCAELCAGCANLVISQRHRSYWKNRQEEFLHALKTAEAEGNTAFAMLCRNHVRVASKILERLDAARARMGSTE